MTMRCALLAAALFSFSSTVSAADQPATWPQFRGPGGSATARGQSIADGIGEEASVVWKIDTPRGHSSPVIWGDRLFLTGYDDSNLLVMCFDRTLGKELWRRPFPKGPKADYFHEDADPAAPTQCTDGTLIYSYFGTVGLVAHDFDGKLVWQKKLPHGSSVFGAGSSPIVDNGRLYVLSDTNNVSALFCFDARTGDEIWMAPRTGNGPGYGTPGLWRQGDQTQVVVAGSAVLTSYDSDDGKQLWTVRNLPILVCPSPIVAGDMLVFGGWNTVNIDGKEMTDHVTEDLGFPKGQPLTPEQVVKRFDRNNDARLSRAELPDSRTRGAFRFVDRNNDSFLQAEEMAAFLGNRAAPGRNVLVAVKAGGSGDITQTHVKWETTRNLPYVSTPLATEDRIVYVRKGGFLTSLNRATGKVEYQKRLGSGGEYYASPVRVGDKVLIAAERGALMIVDQTDGTILSQTQFDEGIYATPAVVDSRVYLRTKNHLFCFGAR